VLRYSLSIALLFLVVLTLVGQEPSRQTSQENWSAEVEGLRGRLIATPLTEPRGPQFLLEIELQNTTNSAAPIEIWWGTWNGMLQFKLEEESGKPVISDVVPGGNNASIPPYWLKLPDHSSIRAVVAARGFEYMTPATPDRLFLRPAVFQGWFLPVKRTSKLFLSAVFTPPKAPEPSRFQWVGPLTLPRVPLP
jgi:hypothetical protein